MEIGKNAEFINIESIKNTLIDPYFNEKIRIKVYKKSIDIISLSKSKHLKLQHEQSFIITF